MVEQEIQNLFISKQWTLALAESCTGGAIASRLVAIPDCSRYFLGSLVAYAPSVKVALLDVNPETLKQFGACSQQIAEEMALGALKKFHANCALAITGNASFPPETGAWVACVRSDKRIFSQYFPVTGDRKEVISQLSDKALQFLYSVI